MSYSTQSSSTNFSRTGTEEQLGGWKIVGVKDRMLELWLLAIETAASRANLTAPRGDLGSPAPQFPVSLSSTVTIRSPTILTDDEIVKHQTMAPAYDRLIYHNLPNWISPITVRRSYWISPTSCIPGAEIRSIRKTWVQSFKDRVLGTDGYHASTPVYVTVHSASPSDGGVFDQHRVIERMHRTQGLREIIQTNEGFKNFTYECILLMRITAVQEALIAGWANKQSDNRVMGTFFSLPENTMKMVKNYEAEYRKKPNSSQFCQTYPEFR